MKWKVGADGSGMANVIAPVSWKSPLAARWPAVENSPVNVFPAASGPVSPVAFEALIAFVALVALIALIALIALVEFVALHAAVAEGTVPRLDSRTSAHVIGLFSTSA